MASAITMDGTQTKHDMSKINALKNLLLKSMHIEKDFYREITALEQEYDKKHRELFNKRAQIISGDHVPTEEEAKWEYPSMLDVANINLESKGEEKTHGIPNFWLTVLRNASFVEKMIFPCDVPILEYLYDVTCDTLPLEEPGFTINFHFKENPHFDNTVLTKTYFLCMDLDEEDPLSYAGPEIVAHQGCKINWKQDKDVTIKTVKKTQKHKESRVKRVVTKTVQNDSFFNFFGMEKTELPEDGDDFMEVDFTIGQFMREDMIPKAVLIYTGEYEDDSDEEDMDDSDCDSDEDEDDSDDSDGSDIDPGAFASKGDSGKVE